MAFGLDDAAALVYIIISLSGLPQIIKDAVYSGKNKKITAQVEAIAREIMKDRARYNAIIQAANNKQDAIVRDLIYSSPVGSRIEKLKNAQREIRKKLDEAQTALNDTDVKEANVNSAANQIRADLEQHPIMTTSKFSKYAERKDIKI